MGIAQQIDQFIKSTNQNVFIEAEAKDSKMQNFIREYNTRFSEQLSISDNGIITLHDNANKWGLELRCYFNNKNGFPIGVNITSNRVYRSEYSYRFNDVDVIWELFDLGYRIGIN